MYVAVPGEQEGLTWIELFILYKMAGYRDAVREPERAAQKRATMGAQLREFRFVLRTVARLTLSVTDLANFKGSPFKFPRLRPLGISTHLAMVPIQMGLQPGARQALAEYILTSQTRLSNKAAAEILKDGKEIPHTEVCVEGSRPLESSYSALAERQHLHERGWPSDRPCGRQRDLQ